MKIRYWLMAAAVLTVACGEDETDTGSSDNAASSSSAVTAGAGSGTGGSNGGSCGGVDCADGQYCQDPTLQICTNGCLSDGDCATEQVCVKPAGQNVGICEGGGAVKDCVAFCSKAMACDPSITQAQCDQACAGLSTACVNCLKDINCSDEDVCTDECGDI